MIAITQENIRKAVKEWCRSPVKAKEKYGDISNWDVSKVTNMHNMFRYAYWSFNGDISRWDVSNIKYMRYMFWEARSYKGDNEGTLRKKSANWNRRKNALIALQDVKTSRVLSLLDLKRYIVSYL